MFSSSSVNVPISVTHLQDRDAQFNSISYLISFVYMFILYFNRRDDVVVRAPASQSVNLGFIPLSSHTESL